MFVSPKCGYFINRGEVKSMAVKKRKEAKKKKK